MFQAVLSDDKGFIICYEDCKDEKNLMRILDSWLVCRNIKHKYSVKITNWGTRIFGELEIQEKVK